ncbi:helix-turn-helix transcriptional regulator [Acinetobacter venetianus]|jgi:predicted DNA-binding transcriptional regulator YafY|uniref:Bifunctional ligase/repressor BirA n=1 Tax=Acinetobacter venetianus TaxID=52133 RepID=A0A150HM65_9GAMM|nr:YafY family protein [Acinetobacter venetianus]HBO72168.1 YafY family transcriptional regulator [Acinetobacter sp.]KXZ63467.1 Bifunctional ligase/repressor BirA [Acinetobacter venetianus]KXZ66582.1 Bifunctional ligase/repressor BirA [Acinetobacter venetianus]MCR4531818.1 YafY family transcriptional regulator [Acinetobacter venetianus]RZG79519.1 YafY family transcriptional regulator [Acinetobacter venetianus]
MSRSIRLLNLLQLLREYRYPVTAQVLAERLQISQRSVYRDIETLRDQGVNIDAAAGLGFQLKEDFLLPPMTLNETEIEAIFLALNWLNDIPDQALKSASKAVLAKLNAVLPEHCQHLLEQTTLRSITAWLPVNEMLVEQVRLAIRQQVKITVDYADEQQRISSRVLWPFALGYFNDRIVLAAWCELRDGFRHFRIDRIQQLSLSQELYPQFKQQLFQQWWTQEVCRATTDKN